MQDVFKLIDAIADVSDKCWVGDPPELAPRTDPNWGRLTWCNKAVREIALKMGYHGFPENMLANDMVYHMMTSGDWEKINMDAAQAFANQGHLVVAGEQRAEHGHVCVVRPGVEVYSGKWAQRCPRVINVGETNFLSRGVNWAFAGIPKFFKWRH